MPEYDGSIIIDTHINTDNFDKDANKLFLKTKDIANSISKSFDTKKIDISNIKDQFVGISPQLQKLQIKIFNTKSSLEYLTNNTRELLGKYGGDIFNEITSLQNKLSKLQLQSEILINTPMISPKNISNAKEASETLKESSKQANNITESVNKASESISNIANNAKRSSKTISSSFLSASNSIRNSFSRINGIFSMVARRTRWLILGQIIRKVFSEVGQSFNDLQTYSVPFEKTAGALTDSFKRTANAIAASFAPIINALAPIIINITNIITNLLNKMSMLTHAMFTNSRTAIIANTNFSGYSKSIAKSTQNTKKNTKAAKEQLKTLAQFDKLDVFKKDKQSKINSPEVESPTQLPQAFDMFKKVEIPSNILDFANNLKETFSPLAKEFEIIGNSFKNNFAIPVGNYIKENVLPRFLNSTREKLKQIDFSNLNISLERLFKVSSKFTNKLFDGLNWAWENIFLQMSKWGAESFLPKFIDLLSNAIDGINITIDNAKPMLKYLIGWLSDIASVYIIKDIEVLSKSIDLIKSSISLLGKTLNSFLPVLSVFLDLLKNTIKDYIVEGLTALGNVFEFLKDAINLFGYSIDRIKPGIDWLVKKIGHISDFMKEILKYGMPGYIMFKSINSIFSATRKNNIPLFTPPALASGTVVSPNKRFLAELGDNTYEPEIVSPISTMKRAFSEAMSENNIGGVTGNVTLQIDGKTFARLINPYMNSEKNRVGISMVQGVY